MSLPALRRLLPASLLVAAPLLAQDGTKAPPRKPTSSATSASTAAGVKLTDPLPIDPKVTVGTLPNGIRYYIRQNPKPEKRAELRLVVNAGSILEDPDQLGLAHFVEHMAFNGTTHFKKNELVNYLESIGVRFGADLNAGTSFDETIYILPVPTDTARIVERAFEILEDWAHGQLFDPTEVTNEKGVVVEEWRGGRGADERMLQQWLPVALKGSRYATRLPIGTKESIEGATPETLRRFYRDWYRPDLQAVIAVGDFDKATIERLIKQHFSTIPKPAQERPRTDAPVPDNKAPLVAVATDKEATSSSVSMYFKLPVTQEKTVADYRRGLIERLYMGMLNTRLAEIAQKPDAPFLGAGASKGRLVRSKDAFTLGAEVKDGGIARGLEALLTEARRVDEFGFLKSELEREKQDLLRGFERAYDEREKTNSGAYVQEYIDNYLTGEPIPGIAYEYDLAKKLVPTITLDEVNRLASDWISDTNRVVVALAPEKPGLTAPTEAELLSVFDRAAKATVTAYTENVSSEALVAKLPAAGKVVAERAIPGGVGVTEWKLSNGVRVLLKPTDFKADEIVMTAYSPGGTGLAPDSTFMSAAFATTVLSRGGLGSFNLIDLQKKLAGKVAREQPFVGETSEGLSGSASPKDLETLFQLVYLQFTAPRLDSSAFTALKNQLTPFLTNRESDPEQVFEDTVNVTMAQHHFRARPLTVATFNEVDPAKSLAFYKDRFADASDFTFVFVGTFTPAALKPLVERYLGALPSVGRKETWKDAGVAPPTGVVERTVKKGVEPKADTRILFTGPFEYTPQNRFALRALTDLLQIKLNETLREQLGGTYSPSVGAIPARIPRPEYTIQIEFGSSPENVEKLSTTTFALIDSLKTNGPTQADVDKVKEQALRSREVQLKQNAYWAQNIAARDEAGEDLAGILTYDEMIKALTPAQIKAAAQKYFDTKHYARFVLLPEK